MIEIVQVSAEIVWPVRHQVMYPELSLKDVRLESDDDSLHLALLEEGKVISVVSLLVNGTELQFRKFATIDDYQGKGYGSRVLKYIIEFARSLHCTRVWCNARKTASNFYRKFGFSETEERFFKHGHEFVIMQLFL